MEINENEISKLKVLTNREKKLASVLSSIARNKPILFLDEPSLYLSNRDIYTLKLALIGYLNAGGIALISTHDSRLFKVLKQT